MPSTLAFTLDATGITFDVDAMPASGRVSTSLHNHIADVALPTNPQLAPCSAKNNVFSSFLFSTDQIQGRSKVKSAFQKVR